MTLERPSDTTLPFFAYGVFRPGEIGFFQLKHLVSSASGPSRAVGALRIRDGLPILDPTQGSTLVGQLLEFAPEFADEAYDRIAAMEPGKQYRWGITSVDGVKANVLVGRSPQKGSAQSDGAWSSWDDPLFVEGLDVVDEVLEGSGAFEFDFKNLFRLQMAYLLLWSSIERYVSLRYHLRGNATEKVDHLAGESAFAQAIRDHVRRRDEVRSAAEPDDKYVLDSSSPKKCLGYYYQIRSNITHRGKAAYDDYDRVRMALAELLPIFRAALAAAQVDAAPEPAQERRAGA